MFSTRPTPRARRALLVGAAVALAAAGLSACSSSSSSTAASPSNSSGTIVLSDAHVNEPTVPDKTGAFATITNSGTTVVNLTGASVPADVAMSAQVHETKDVGGEMQMTQIAAVPVPAGGQLVLKSGGYHVMLMSPKVSIGQVVPLTLMFSDGSKITIDAPVKAAAPMASGSASSMG